jgi:hypothetical protein
LYALKATPKQLATVPKDVGALPVLHEPGKVLGDPPDATDRPVNGTTDNCNTQFALLAMWTARHYDVPMQRTLDLLVTRFRNSQNTDGGWGYRFRQNGGEGGSPPMICCGLLGMAVAHGLAHDAELKEQQRQAAAAAHVLTVMAAPPLAAGVAPAAALVLPPEAEPAPAAGAAPAAPGLAKDPMVVKGFTALSQHLGTPTGRVTNLKQENLYFLWSLERVSVLYDLHTIGDKEWFRWGAEILVANQEQLGNWKDGGYPGATPVIDTCFALLFLKRVNLIPDLARKLPPQAEDLNKSVQRAAAPEPKPADADKAGKKDESKLATAAPAPPAAPPAPPSGTGLESKTPAPDPKATATRPEDDAEAAPLARRLWPWLLLLAALLLLVGGGALVLVSRLGAAKEPEPSRPRRREGGRRAKKTRSH